MSERLSPRRRALTALADFLLLALGMTGTAFCLISAFDFPVNGLNLYFLPALCALLAVGVYSLPRRLWRVLLVLAVLALVCLEGWLRWDSLRLGGLVVARNVTGAFAEALNVGGPFDITPYVGKVTPLRESRAMEHLLRMFLELLGLWLGFVVVRARSFWPAFWSIFPFLMVPLSVTISPEWPALVLVLLFCCVGLLTRLIRRGNPWGGTKLTLLLLLPSLALLLVLGAAFPREGYVQGDWAGQTRLKLADLVTRTSHGGVTADGGLGLAVGGAVDVDLGSAGPLDFDGRTVLRVQADLTGHIYLRGFSAAVYTGAGWEQLPDESYEELRSGWTERIPDYTSSQYPVPELEIERRGVGDYQPLNFPAMADANLPAVRMMIENVGAPDRFVYTPYQLITTPERMSGAQFIGDAYLARGTGVWKHILYVRAQATPEHGNAMDGDAAEAELAYRKFVERYYLQIPEDMKPIIEDLVADAGIEAFLPRYSGPIVYGYQDSLSEPVSIEEYERWYAGMFELNPGMSVKLGNIVAEYLSTVAEYDPETPAAPAGEDFVACFVGAGRGYCMHFASTAVLMLRAMGVPARYVSGYVADVKAGERVDVPDYNAHAWVEVYCDGYGWQPVEVTPGFNGVFPWETQGSAAAPTPTPSSSAAPQQSAAPAPSAAPVQTPAPTQRPGGGLRGQNLRWFGLLLALLLAALALAARRRLARERRAKRFLDPDANLAAIGIYGYALRVLAHSAGGKINDRARDIAEKAKFSLHTITEPERKVLLDYATSLAAAVDRALPWYKRWVFRYILGLY